MSCSYYTELFSTKVRKMAKIRNQYNQVPHLTQDTTWESDNPSVSKSFYLPLNWSPTTYELLHFCTVQLYHNCFDNAVQYQIVHFSTHLLGHLCNIRQCSATITLFRHHCTMQWLFRYIFYSPGHVAQSVTCLATDASLTADPGVASSIPARSHTFVEIDH